MSSRREAQQLVGATGERRAWAAIHDAGGGAQHMLHRTSHTR